MIALHFCMNHEATRQFGAHIEVGLLQTVPRGREASPGQHRDGATCTACVLVSAYLATAIEPWSRQV